MVLKCALLMYYKNSRGRNYRRQVNIRAIYIFDIIIYYLFPYSCFRQQSQHIPSIDEIAYSQGQILTLVEYMLLLYRALLPAPVWYRFFLNKEYGSLFSSLMTGLYLTFKLTSVVEKVAAECYSGHGLTF